MESIDDLFTWNESADEAEWTEDDVSNFDNFLQAFDDKLQLPSTDKQYIKIKPKQVLVVVEQKAADEKKYLCAKCGKHFTRKWGLKRHTIKIHGDYDSIHSRLTDQGAYTRKWIPGVCMICYKKFSRKTRCETTPTIGSQIFNFTL